MSTQSSSWADDKGLDDVFPPLGRTRDNGRTSGRNNGTTAAARKSKPAKDPKPMLPSTFIKYNDVSADNALAAMKEVVNWADTRKSGPGPPGWWKEISLVLNACITAFDGDATRSSKPSSGAADRAQGVGSLPLDGGSALADGGSLPRDGGSPELAKIMERLHAQHLEVMSTLASLSPSSPSSTHPNNAVPPTRPPAPPAQPGTRIIAQPQAPSLSLSVTISELDANSPLNKQSAADLKSNIERHLSNSKIPHLAKTTIHSVRRDRTKLRVHAHDLAQKNALIKNPGEWLTKIDDKATVSVRKILLQADLVSTKFDAASSNAITALATSNPTVITDPSDVISVRWIHDRKHNKTQTHSSLSIAVSNPDLARDLIRRGLCILGEYSPVIVQPPTAQQCYTCQGFGHNSSTCRAQPNQRPHACARCASHDHYTSNCQCPATTKCADMRTCTHIKICCINCGGAHKSFAAVCPVKANEIAKAQSNPSYVSLVLELTTAPPSKGGATRP